MDVDRMCSAGVDADVVITLFTCVEHAFADVELRCMHGCGSSFIDACKK